MASRILSSTVIYKKDWVEVLENRIKLSNGNVVDWPTVNVLHDAVCGVVLDDENNIYLVKEWRPVWEKEVTGIPAGAVSAGVSEQEIILQLHNELREELGLDAKKTVKLSAILSSARIRLRNHIYLATDLFESRKERSEDELIEIVKMPFKKAYERFVEKGEETTGSTVIGIMMAKERLGL